MKDGSDDGKQVNSCVKRTEREIYKDPNFQSLRGKMDKGRKVDEAMVTKRQRRRQATVQRLKDKLRKLQEEPASYGGEQSEMQKLRLEQEKQRQEHATEMAALQEKMAEQASRYVKEHKQLKELLNQRTAECKQMMQQQQGIEQTNGVLKYGMATTAVGNEAQIELEAKLHESEGKVEALETEVRRLRQGCQPGAVLPKELKENDRLKAELAEMQKELSAYGGERQGEEAMEEFHDCQTQEDWTRMEHTAKQMELSQMQMALKEAEKQTTVAEAQKDLQIKDSALKAERDATNVEFTAGLIEFIAGFNMGWFRPTQ
jgi:hypothetical protein